MTEVITSSETETADLLVDLQCKLDFQLDSATEGAAPTAAQLSDTLRQIENVGSRILKREKEVAEKNGLSAPLSSQAYNESLTLVKEIVPKGVYSQVINILSH